MRYWKILSGTKSNNGGSFDWKHHLPTKAAPGTVTPVRQVRVCESGWHLSTDEGLRTWLRSADVFLARGIGREEDDGDGTKVAFEQCQLLKRIKVSTTTFIQFALDGLNKLPVKSMSKARRKQFEAAREALFMAVATGSVVVPPDEVYAELEEDRSFYEDIERVYEDYNKPVPKDVKDALEKLNDADDNPFSTLLDELQTGGAPCRSDLACVVASELQDLHQSFRGPLVDDASVYKLLGDVLEQEAVG